MDLTRLRYFCAVAQRGGIRRAALDLHLSPTALSKAVKLLEQEVGVPLLEPLGRGIVLTDDGRRLATLAEPLINEFDALPNMLTTRHGGGAPIRLGSHEAFLTYAAPRLLDRRPELSLQLRYLAPGRIERALVEHDIDIGVTLVPALTQGVEHDEVASVPMGVFGLPAFDAVPFEQLPFAAPARVGSGAAIRARGVDGWPDDRIGRTVAHFVTQTESALALCRSGCAVGYFPAFVVSLHNQHTIASAQLVELASPLGDEDRAMPVLLARRTSDARRHAWADVRAWLADLSTLAM